MLIEVYNEAGDLILDNETKVLKTVGRRLCSGEIYALNGRTPPNVWASDWSIPGRVAGTGRYVEWVTNPIFNGGTSYNSTVTWTKPLDGSACLISQILGGVAADSNWNVMGPGVEFAFTDMVVPADASGFMDCYNEAGELTWSLSALLTVPQILGAYDAETTRSISLLSFPERMRNNIFFATPTDGTYEIPGEGMATYYAIQVARQGNTINFNSIDNDNSLRGDVVMAAYIP
ncbi:hypothetical protein MW368_003694 [Acinetobacter baumannii]|nr:hypothetical protein [Acinetobacter baumannii]